MKQLIIRIKPHARSHAVDFQFPGEIPVRDLIPLLVQVNGWPERNDEGTPLFYWFERQNEVLDDSLTLLASGIRHGMTLYVRSGDKKPESIRNKKAHTEQEANKSPDILKDSHSEPLEPETLDVEFEPIGFPQNLSVQDRRSQIAPPSDWKVIEDKDIYG
jgi:hypothetical protein